MQIRKGKKDETVNFKSPEDIKRALSHPHLKTVVMEVTTSEEHRRLLAHLDRLSRPYSAALITLKN